MAYLLACRACGYTFGNSYPLKTPDQFPSQAFLRDRRFGYRTFEDIRKAMRALADGQVDAVVHDEPVLRYLANTEFRDARLEVVDRTFQRQDYGFALPENSPRREPINRELLRQLSTEHWEDLKYRYMGHQ